MGCKCLRTICKSYTLKYHWLCVHWYTQSVLNTHFSFAVTDEIDEALAHTEDNIGVAARVSYNKYLKHVYTCI